MSEAESNPKSLSVAWLFAGGLLLIVFVFDPLGLFDASGSDVQASSPQIAATAAYIREQSYEPTGFLVEALSRYDLVMLGELGRIKQQIEVTTEAIAPLHEAGLEVFATEYLLAGDQQRIDRLVTADRFDEEEAAALLFRRMAVWGFEEYRDLIREIWRINNELPAGAEPLRLVGLSVREYFEYYTGEGDLEDPDVVARVLQDGVPDKVMADILTREVLEPGVKAVAYTGIEHSFTGYEQTRYQASMADLGFDEVRRAGNILHDEYGERVGSVHFHAPWPDPRSRNGFSYAAGGLIDGAIDRLEQDERYAGFFIEGSPMDSADLQLTGYGDRQTPLRLSEVADGYIITGKLAYYTAPEPIEGFINERNLAEAIRFFPGDIPDDTRPEDLTNYSMELVGNLINGIRSFDRF